MNAVLNFDYLHSMSNKYLCVWLDGWLAFEIEKHDTNVNKMNETENKPHLLAMERPKNKGNRTTIKTKTKYLSFKIYSENV